MGKGKNRKAQGEVVRLDVGSKAHSMTVEIAGTGKSFQVPLSDSLSMADAMRLRKVNRLPKKDRADAQFDAVYDIICRYVPRKYIDQLSMDDFSVLVDAWVASSAEAGVTPGE